MKIGKIVRRDSLHGSHCSFDFTVSKADSCRLVSLAAACHQICKVTLKLVDVNQCSGCDILTRWKASMQVAAEQPVEFLTDVQIMLSRNIIHLCSFIKI